LLFWIQLPAVIYFFSQNKIPAVRELSIYHITQQTHTKKIPSMRELSTVYHITTTASKIRQPMTHHNTLHWYRIDSLLLYCLHDSCIKQKDTSCTLHRSE
jgi:hypothetical protein